MQKRKVCDSNWFGVSQTGTKPRNLKWGIFCGGYRAVMCGVEILYLQIFFVDKPRQAISLSVCCLYHVDLNHASMKINTCRIKHVATIICADCAEWLRQVQSTITRLLTWLLKWPLPHTCVNTEVKKETWFSLSNSLDKTKSWKR